MRRIAVPKYFSRSVGSFLASFPRDNLGKLRQFTITHFDGGQFTDDNLPGGNSNGGAIVYDR